MKNKKKHNQELTKHHILPSSKWWGNYHKNIIKLKRIVHQSIHNIFENATPTEQIQILMNINTTALTEDFKEDVRNILSETDPLYYYDKWIYKLRK